MNTAKYRDQSSLPESVRDNILAQQLPLPESIEEILEKMSVTPDAEDLEVRSLPLEYRMNKLDSLQNVYLPTDRHASALQRVVRLMRWGYRYRDPDNPVVTKFIYDLIDKGPGPGLSRQGGGGGAIGLVITGPTGTGKTSFLDRLSAYLGANVLIHTEIGGRECRQPQILHLRIQCPEKSSLGSLTLSILDKIDEQLGTRHGQAAKNLSIPKLSDRVCAMCTTYFVGAVIIDDVQHLPAGHADTAAMLNFFTNFMERTGIPLILTGTVKLDILLAAEPSAASKLSAKGKIQFTRLEEDSEEWWMLCNTLWMHSITDTLLPMPEELPRELHFYTQGISRILRETMYVIHERMAANDEPFSTDMLKNIAANELLKYQSVMQAIRLNTIGRLSHGETSDWKDFIPSEKEGRILQKALQERQDAEKQAKKLQSFPVPESTPERLFFESVKAMSPSIQDAVETENDVKQETKGRSKAKVSPKPKASKKSGTSLDKSSGYERAKDLGWTDSE